MGGSFGGSREAEARREEGDRTLASIVRATKPKEVWYAPSWFSKLAYTLPGAPRERPPLPLLLLLLLCPPVLLLVPCCCVGVSAVEVLASGGWCAV